MAADWYDRLRAESERWVKQGLIGEEQRGAILKLYPADAAENKDRAVIIFSLLGSLLVGAGVILYFAANWPLIAPWVKVTAILAATLASYGAGYYFQYHRGDSPRLGQALVFLGSLLYGAGVWLIAQIFHLDTDFPTGFLAWGAGVLPVVWATGSRPVLYLASGLLIIWTGAEQGEYQHYNLLFPVLMLGAVLPPARRTETRLAEAAVLMGLFFWYIMNVGWLDFSHAQAPTVAMAGRLTVLYGSGLFLAGLARLGDARTWLGSGALLGLAGSYMLTFAVPRWALPAERALPSLFAGSPFTLAGVMLMLLGVAGTAWVYARRGESGRQYLLAAALLPVGAVLLAEWLPEAGRMLFFNIILFGGAVGLVGLGLQRRLSLLLNLGLLAVAVHGITRYFDLFFTALDRSLFFILGGALLLAGGWALERNRRRWMGEWGGGGNAP